MGKKAGAARGPAQQAASAGASGTWASVKMRGSGFLVAGLVFLMPVYLFASVFILQFLCLFLLFIIIGSRLYAEYLIRHIRVVRRDAELREFRQQWVTVELVAENRGRLPAFMLAISDTPGMLPLFKESKVACTLPGRSRMVHFWQGFCSERGLFSLGPAVARGSDPLGLFPFQLICPQTARLFVYPAPCLAGLAPSGGIPLGSLLTRNILYEDLSRPRSLRPYQTGDEPRRINWKASARLSGGQTEQHNGFGMNLMVNEFEATISFPLMVFLNIDINAYPVKKGIPFMERAIEAAAALCLSSLRERQSVGIIIFSRADADTVAPSPHTSIPILERLALAEHGEREAPPAAENTGEDADGRTNPGAAQDEQDKNTGGPDGSPARADAETQAAQTLLDKAKQLSYGTRVVYVGPDLAEADYIKLSVLKRFRLNVEYLIIDEKSLPVRGNAKQYQMKEMGYEIL